jgi:hypothetical protein
MEFLLEGGDIETTRDRKTKSYATNHIVLLLLIHHQRIIFNVYIASIAGNELLPTRKPMLNGLKAQLAGYVVPMNSRMCNCGAPRPLKNLLRMAREASL